MNLSSGLFVRKRESSIYTLHTFHSHEWRISGCRERIHSFLSKYFSSMEPQQNSCWQFWSNTFACCYHASEEFFAGWTSYSTAFLNKYTLILSGFFFFFLHSKTHTSFKLIQEKLSLSVLATFSLH